MEGRLCVLLPVSGEAATQELGGEASDWSDGREMRECRSGCLESGESPSAVEVLRCGAKCIGGPVDGAVRDRRRGRCGEKVDLRSWEGTSGGRVRWGD